LHGQQGNLLVGRAKKKAARRALAMNVPLCVTSTALEVMELAMIAYTGHLEAMYVYGE
jgi:hypothetical protein